MTFKILNIAATVGSCHCVVFAQIKKMHNVFFPPDEARIKKPTPKPGSKQGNTLLSLQH